MPQSIENKFIQVNKWPAETSDLELAKETISTSNIKENEILIKMIYSCVDPVDLVIFKYPFSPNFKNNKVPSKVGFEGIGKIIQVGRDVKDHKVGEHVLPLFPAQREAWQQYSIVTDIDQKIPSDVPLEVGAQFFCNPRTVLGIIETLGLDLKGNSTKPGWFAQYAANSQVGRMIQQILGRKGQKALAIVRKQEAVKELEDLGAKVLVTGNLKTKEELTKAIIDATNGEGVSYGVDCIQGWAGQALFDAMAENGKFLQYGNLSGQPFNPIESKYPNPKRVDYLYFMFSIWFSKLSQTEQEEYKNYIVKLYKEGLLKLPVEKIFKLEDFKEAFDYQENFPGARTGKILLKNN